MGILNDALFESFNMDEDFAEEVAETADESVEDNKIEESVKEEVEEKEPEPIKEAIIKESSDIGRAIDEYESLIRKDIPPAKARAMVTGEEEIQESLNESMVQPLDEVYDRGAYAKRIAERFIENSRHDLTVENLKYEDWKIFNAASKAGITKNELKEALLEEINKNED